MNAPAPLTDVRFEQAATAFRGFFLELGEAFQEREALFIQLELALLCREHVLIIGPPGTAKSAVAAAVLGRIVDARTNQPSLFAKQLAENTVQTDLIGPVDFKVLTETGRTEYLTDEGMLGAVHAFLDEVFDGRDMLLRSILNVLHERELKHGRRVTQGSCECAVMTSNRYLSEVLQRSPETLQAFADRISFICFTPKSFARKTSRTRLLWRANEGQRPSLHQRLTLQELDVLQEAVSSVTVPPAISEALEVLSDSLEKELVAQVLKLPDYVSTKYFSQRTVVKALWALKAAVVRDCIYNRPERALVAELADLDMLRYFFLLGGPPPEHVELLIKGAADPRERAQLEIIRVEHRAFTEVLRRVGPTVALGVEQEASDLRVEEDLTLAESLSRGWLAPVASSLSRGLRDKLIPGPRHPENRVPMLRAADLVVAAAEQRLASGPSNAEGRGGAALFGSLSEVLELVRRVPELCDRSPKLSGAMIELCRQSQEMIALAAEGAEFEEVSRLDAVLALALRLSEELGRIAELLQTAALTSPAEASRVRATAAPARQRAAEALRRQAGRVMTVGSPGKKGEALALLVADSRRLGQLEDALVALSPTQRGLREELLVPRVEAYAKELIGTAAIQSLDHLARLLHTVVETVRREGGSVERALQSVKELVEVRVRDLARGMSAPRRAEPSQGGEAYAIYSSQLAAGSPSGALASLRTIESLLSLGGLTLAPKLRDSLAAAELGALAERIKFLRAWLSRLLAALPGAGGQVKKAELEKAFDSLVGSRFPLLVTREGELVRLRAELEALATEPGDVGQAARTLDRSLQSVAEDFQAYSQWLLSARGSR